ncbi:MAG TPA: hypothetical protein VK474_06715 [Chthoniobacterales bacterium]|nr:hypothetical protein [Chthoniobacterales bacterium]
MKWLSGGLTLVNVATVAAVFLGMLAAGLGPWTAFVSILLGLIAAIAAFVGTRAEGDAAIAAEPAPRSRSLWFWIVAGCFGFFAFRAFCWLIFLDGNDIKVQSVNNLGDLALHLTYIRNLASGVPLWPENPIYVFSHLRYPVGTDLFNSLLLLLGVDLFHGLIWAGLIGSLASFFALYRWGGAFGVAGFLFNGGLAGLQFFQNWKLLDYQGDKSIAWKSLPIAMLVTQRGLLYALPAGLLLLCHWRAQYFEGKAEPAPDNARPRLLPFWVVVSLYATMPLFHVHTFMALSIVAAFLFLTGDREMRWQLGLLVGLSFLPATFFVWTITDHFKASSLVQWQIGWVQGQDDYSAGLRFWFENFGILPPLVIALIGWCVMRALGPREAFRLRAHPGLAFLAPAALIFLFACLVKTAPWGWDNIKLILWAYLIMLPFLWSELIARWSMPVRAGTCFVLFLSGFISLCGGLLTEPGGQDFADRAELDAVARAVRKLPVQARFAAFPTYNHPLLLEGRKVVLGYPGHLWTQGFDYAEVEKQLNALMAGAPDWKKQARQLRVRYLFWGREETKHYSASLRPWEAEMKPVARGNWGAIYDLEASAQGFPARQ